MTAVVPVLQSSIERLQQLYLEKSTEESPEAPKTPSVYMCQRALLSCDGRIEDAFAELNSKFSELLEEERNDKTPGMAVITKKIITYFGNLFQDYMKMVYTE